MTWQDSLTEQLQSVERAAIEMGCYDAADWMRRRQQEGIVHQQALIQALTYEATVISAQTEDVKALAKSRREALAHCTDRLRALARGEFPYVQVGRGMRAARPDDL